MNKEKKHNLKELFRTIDAVLEEKGLKPGILDYGIGGDASVEILSDSFDVVPRACFGGNEGIYLDIRLEDPAGKSFSNGKSHVILGTYKTLGKSHDHYRAMALLGCEFVFAFDEYYVEHADEFNWMGYDVSLFRGGASAGKIWTPSRDGADRRAEDFLLRNPSGSVLIRDNSSRQEWEFQVPA